MKGLLRWITIALLGCLLTIGLHIPPGVRAQAPVVSQEAAVQLMQTGKQQYDAGQFAEAAKSLQQAASLYAAISDRPGQAQSLSLSSLAYQKLGQWQNAQTSINTSLNLLGVPDQPIQNPLILAQVFNAKAHLQLAQGQTEAALETWQTAETLYRQGQDQTGMLGSQMNQVQALRSLGLLRRAEKQLSAIEQALLQLPDSSLKVAGLQNLGTVRRQSGDVQRSRDLLLQALQLAEKLRLADLESQVHLNLGNSDQSLASRAKELNDTATAQQASQSALRHYQQAAAMARAPATRLQGQVNHLSLLLDSGQERLAQAVWSDLEQTLPRLPASRSTVYAQVHLALNWMKAGQAGRSQSEGEVSAAFDQIPDLLNRAVQQAQAIEDQRAISYALGALGQWWESAQRWEAASATTQQALQIAQAITAPDLVYQWQWQMGRLRQRQAEQRSGRSQADATAIAHYTQAIKILGELRSDLVALNPDVQFSFRDSVEPVYRQLVDLLLRGSPTQANLTQARRVIEALQLAELDNFFRDACAKPESVEIDDLDATAATVYPILLDDRLEVILKLPGQETLRHYSHAGVSVSQVNAAIESFQLALQRRSTSPSDFKRTALPLYDWLIRPFERELESAIDRSQSQIKTLVFVLDGPLRNIPPAALNDGNRYLVERYAIAITPGLQLVDPQPLQREQLQALIAGTSDAPSFQREGLSPIDNVEIELIGIQQQVSRSQKLANQAFLKENVQQQIRSRPFNVVHIATHGQFSSNPEQTFILDWNQRITIRDLDTLLRLRDGNADDYPNGGTALHRSPIELLILSACETASGDNRAALGLAGIAIRAGARSTLATLFRVNDASTAELMIRFYRQLADPRVTKAEALRSAQLAFLTEYPDTDYHRPYYWSGFILVGNWL